jgi:hypothetical protein
MMQAELARSQFAHITLREFGRLHSFPPFFPPPSPLTSSSFPPSQTKRFCALGFFSVNSFYV